MEEILTSLSGLWTRLLTLLLDPATDIGAALALYAILGTLLAIILVIAIMFVVGSPEDEAIDSEHMGIDHPPLEKLSEPPDSDVPPPLPPRTPKERLAALGITVAVASLVWVIAGYSTSTTWVCASCHTETVHTVSDTAADPHSGVSCVACHEPGGLLARVSIGLPDRSMHFLSQLAGIPEQYPYGRPTQAACLNCHSPDVAGVALDDYRGIRVSHQEPLEAGATCLDCHRLADGSVAAHNAGMSPCLRCHNATIASAACDTCHVGDPAAASAPSTANATVQIENLSCGGCHDEERSCDPCHGGFRLPHSREFIMVSHARVAFVDFVENDGRRCAQCHTETRNPCSQCHTPMLGSAHGPGLMQDHQGATAAGCDTCHQQWAFSQERDFCADVCHTDAAIRYSPR
ncbi:MAG: hypothetical protein M1565_03760 [Actinobacteria bacterium]|nr:hypothetical protein [Actinomycetota bacterium]